MTSDSACNSWGNKDYVSQNLSLKSANGHVLHPRLHLHRQLLGNGPHTICSPRHYQLQAVQDHQGKLSKFHAIFLVPKIPKHDFFSIQMGKKRTSGEKSSTHKVCLSAANAQQSIVRTLAEATNKITLSRIRLSQEKFDHFSGYVHENWN